MVLRGKNAWVSPTVRRMRLSVEKHRSSFQLPAILRFGQSRDGEVRDGDGRTPDDGVQFVAWQKFGVSAGEAGNPRVRSNSYFGPERGCVVSTSRSSSATPKDFLVRSVLRLVLRT